jgi:hypothetical protein
MAGERQKLIENRAAKEVKEMYNEVLAFSERWAREFREFWNLADDFVFKP